MFWRCLHCETHNAPERSHCLICEAERLYTASELGIARGVDFNGQTATQWWNALPKAYRTRFGKIFGFTGEPDGETLLRIRFATRLDFSRIAVDSVEPLAAIPYLERLNLNKTRVQSLAPLAKLRRLTELRLDGTPIESLSALKGLENLKKLYVRGCGALTESEVVAFRAARPGCKVFAGKPTSRKTTPSKSKPADTAPKADEKTKRTSSEDHKRSIFSIFKRK